MTDADEAPEELQLTFLGQHLDPHRLVYGTIILMTTFSVYEGASDTQFGDTPFLTLAGVLLAPLVALAMAHAFSEALDLNIRLKHSLTRADRLRLVKGNLQYVYLAIPPMALIFLLIILNFDASDVVAIVQVTGLASLFGWGYFAGSKAGLSRLRRAGMALAYMLSGLVVIILELFLTH